MQVLGNTVAPEIAISMQISQTVSFQQFSKGVCVWGCNSGNFSFGEKGGNIFIENIQGLVLNANIEVTC